MRVTTEPLEELAELFVHHGVVRDGVNELLFLFCRGQFTVEQQVADFKVVGLFSQLFDRVAAVQQHALATIDIGDLGFAGRSGHEAGVVGEQAFAGQWAYIYDVGTFSAGIDRQFDRFVQTIDCQTCFLVSHQRLLSFCFVLLRLATEPLHRKWPEKGPTHYRV